MRCRLTSLVALLALGACPERKTPEHGTELRFAPKAGARDVLAKRLANLKVTARLTADDDGVSVRLPQGSDVPAIRAALSMPGVLEICQEDPLETAKWCQLTEFTGVSRQDDCTVIGPDEATVRVALKTTRPLAFERVPGSGLRGIAQGPCSALTVVDAAIRDEAPTVAQLIVDQTSAKTLAEVTRKTLHHRALILLDGTLLLAPVVQDVISGGKLAVTLPGDDAAATQRLISALTGGSIPGGLVLLREREYGPPSIGR